MKFATPQMFWLLLILVGPLILFLWWAWRRRQQLVTQFISARLLGHLKVGFSPSRQKARMAIFVAAVILIIFALARPQWGVNREEARQRGLDIMIAIDTSNSMLAEDTPPNRLARAKLAVLDLMRRARTDRLGLIAFAGSAFLECPLTLDDAAFSQSVNALDTHTISQGGTAIAEAIDEARKAFKSGTDNHRILVLFTDGEDHDGDALEAAQKAAKEGMMIFAIGIGSAEGEQLRIRDERGHVNAIQDEQGKPVISHLNEELLQQIATATKGFYLPLRGTKTMDTLYERGLAPLPKSENSVKMFQRFHERFYWPLGIAMALLIVEMFLPDRGRRRSAPSPADAAKAAGLTQTAALILLLALPAAVHASPASALREYNEGKYEDSLKDYSKLLEKKKDDPRLHFNAGAAAYQSHQLDQAVKEFNESLASPDLQLQQRSYYNLGNTLYRQGQQLPDSTKRQESWENSMKHYESALKLNQQDPDAKFNLEFVKKQLEELKKQQQQQQQSDKNSKQDQKQDKDKQNQQNQNQKDKDQQQQQQNQQSQDKKDGQDQQSKNQGKQDDKQKSEQEKKQQEEDKQKQDQSQDKQQKQDSAEEQQEKERQKEEAQKEAQMMAAGQMTPRQAQQLLDSQKDQDKIFQIIPPDKRGSQRRSFKNW